MIMKHIQEILIFAKFCAELTEANKEFKSVRLAKEVVACLEVEDTKQASVIMDKLLDYIISIHWCWTREESTIDRLINSSIYKTGRG